MTDLFAGLQRGHYQAILGRSAVAKLPTQPAQLRCDPLKAGTFHVTELEEGMCRYPTGDREILFCGSPQVVGRAYCADHLALTVQPARPHEAVVSAQGGA